MQIKKLSELAVGEEALVDTIATSHRELRVKLQSFGLTRGTLVEVKSMAPFGDPITISVRGFSLSLRKSEAEAVQVSTQAILSIPTELPLVANS